MYAFRRFREAIAILEQVIMKMPELADAYTTIANIYEEMGDYERSMVFGIMGAYLLKTDVDRWIHCA